MSGPMPAGSPSVSAKGKDIGLLRDIRRQASRNDTPVRRRAVPLVAQFLEEPRRVGLKVPGIDLLLGLLLADGIVLGGRLLGAQRVDLDALHGGFRWRQLAELGLLQDLAL